MKKWYKYITLMLLMAVCMLFAACDYGATVDTTLTFGPDTSGMRKMTVTIDDAVFSENFSGSYEDLQAIVKECCPKEMVATVSQNDGKQVLNFMISFSSKEEYLKKLTSIDPNLNAVIRFPSSALEIGYDVEENFSSEDLLVWLKDELINRGMVLPENKSYILQAGSTKLDINGNVIDMDSRIYLNTLTSIVFAGVSIYTDIKDLDIFDRKYSFSIDADIAKEKNAELKEYFNGKLVNKAKLECSTEDESYTKYIISAQNISFAELTQLERSIFEASAAQIKDIDIDNYEFAFCKKVREEIPMTDFALDNRSLRVNYCVKISDKVRIGESYPAYTKETLDYSSDYNDYCLYNYQFVDADTPYILEYWLGHVYYPDTIESSTDAKNSGKFVKTTTFSLNTVPTDEEQKLLIERFEKKMDVTKAESAKAEDSVKDKDSSDSESKASTPKSDGTTAVSATVDDNVYKLSVKIAGPLIYVRERLQVLTDKSVNLVIGENFSLPKFTKGVAFTESTDYRRFFSYSGGKQDLQYTLDMGLGSKVKLTDHADAVVKKNKVSISFSDGSVKVGVTAGRFNLWAVLFYLTLLATFVFIVLTFAKTKIISETIAASKSRKENAQTIESKEQTESKEEAEETASDDSAKSDSSDESVTSEGGEESSDEVTKESSDENEGDDDSDEDDMPMFCTKCGAKRDADACVCVKCGTKFTD